VSARVLVLTPYPYGTTAGPRSSFELWERALAEADISLDYAVFETERLHAIVYQRGRTAKKGLAMADAYARFLPKARHARSYDAVLVNREAALIGPAFVERWVARMGTPIIYWLDDPLYIPYRSPSNGWLSYLKFFGKVKNLCRLSTAVIVNSSRIAAFARRHNANVWEIPTVVDADRYTGWLPSSERPDGRVGIGWIGSHSTSVNLQVVRRPLRELGRRGDIDIRFIGADHPLMADVAHTAVPWHAETEVDELRRLDIGLVPLLATPWASHKFYLKPVQYMALGIPPVATPLGANPNVITDGKTGFLAANDDEWTATLERLVASAELRERTGRLAAEFARDHYTLQANAERIVAAFRSALG
jgi:glycosyltransferase involved in cell wall biosynthesis